MQADAQQIARLVADSSIKKNYRKAILLVSNLGDQLSTESFESKDLINLKCFDPSPSVQFSSCKL